ncbi:SIS domain-containing protein [Bradyrhizobium iriomotense]|uniref:Glucosamine--fructose-6-phosphate aminotransferase n=1 Tax=Bradyrhizobium iriomotense TaxID=441950 RepID=A0ABQ6ATZ8_9BRAD|nr:SIS domain-containing protein [Bradyrhizobium iriomotense]GLR83387.1 glucosamine--fructose-6-phosphate aminotransferase [Bradyrhizobium iriomotense]
MTTHMFQEIGEAGDAVARQLGQNAERLAELGARLRGLDPPLVATIARGSSDCCALYLKYLVEIVSGVPCASIGPSIATLYRTPMRLEGGVSVAISQSGRSPDIVEMQRAARRGGALAVALVNDVASPLAQEAEVLLPLCAGTECSVAATKSMVAGLVAGASLVAAWREDRPLADALTGLPDVLRGQAAPPPAAMLERLANARSAFVLGRGATLAIAAEAALKLKETCAIHAEAYSAAEVLHGPAELVAPGFPVIAFLPSDAAREGMLPTLAALANAGATVITIEAGGADEADRLATAKVEATLLEPIVMIHRFYRLAEALARQLGRDPDRPRNLRKVTETV